MSGYANSASHLNEDWLISPQLNLSGYSDEVLQFQTAMNYTGEVLDVLISTNYSGSGDPNQAYWEELQATLSAGGWAWTFSGNIPISAFASGNCHIAFKYTSSDSESSTWEVDEIRVYGQSQTGINPVSSFRNRVYPNPAVQSLFIKVQEAGEAALYSLTGERLMNLSQIGRASCRERV